MKGKRSYSISIIPILVIVFIGLVFWGIFSFLNPLSSFMGQKANITSGEVVEKIRSASYLTTTRYTIRLVASSNTPGNWWALGQDYKKMLLVAKGTVEAGIDLKQLDASDVSVSEDGKSITVTLPPVKILNRNYSLSNDPMDTYVYDASSGLFADTTNQQTELRSTANEELVKSACKGEIMQQANSYTKFATERLLKTLWPDVNITVLSGRMPSDEECTSG